LQACGPGCDPERLAGAREAQILRDGHENAQAAERQPARWGPTCGAVAPPTRFRGDSR
jgi:hypothetical protein